MSDFLSLVFQQVDAVLRAATSIVNSAKLKKLFKVTFYMTDEASCFMVKKPRLHKSCKRKGAFVKICRFLIKSLNVPPKKIKIDYMMPDR